MSHILLITGSSGLIGSEMVKFFAPQFERILGLDNNLRRDFFGAEGDTSSVLQELSKNHHNFEHLDMDIRDREGINTLFQNRPISSIVHCAAQPSHDLAAQIPFQDFEVNALGTLNLLEATRKHRPESPFVFISTNKVYGDLPNQLPLEELETRYDFLREEDRYGISEAMSIDQSLHSLFGVSKASADLLVQEYGRNFSLKTTCLRGGCLTGPNHRGTRLHGFLSYLVRTNLTRTPYTIFGYKGKQVRDNIHSQDVAACVGNILADPCRGEVFNLGGGRANSCSMLEAMERIQSITGIEFEHSYSEEARVGDHICYYTDNRKFQTRYPGWNISYSLDSILKEIYEQWQVEFSNKG
ncbi:NAD-dependent epimerase/dehydratase family protein [bacterium]|jgi:CDP-paratose 2-epimerase|nr:NAD-dependent epimerase/dehydratase family protein [bacterium]